MTEEQLKRTYRLLLKKYHPDTGGENADEVAIRNIIEEYKKLTSRRSSKENDATKNTNGTIVPLSEWTMPTSTNDTDKFILDMLKLIAARRAEDMPTDMLAAHISFCSECDNADSHILTLTALAEIAELTRLSHNEYDPDCEAALKRICEYAQNIAEATSILTRLNLIAPPKSGLVCDILRSIKKCSSEPLRNLLNSYLVMIISLEI